MKNGLLGKELINNDLTIAGAGISGLALGFFLKRNAFQLELLEAKKNSGGLIQTTQLKMGYSEAAANSFIPCAATDFIEEETNINIIPALGTSSKRYLIKDEKLTTFPLSFVQTLKLPFQFFQKQNWAGGTVEELGHTFFGKEVTRNLIEPALAGIYGADIKFLDVQAMFPEFNDTLKEKKRLYPTIKESRKHLSKSKKYQKRGTYSLRGGMQEMVDGLTDFLSDEIKFEQPLTILPKKKDTIICLPAYITAKLFEGHEIGQELNRIFYTPVISVTLFFKKSDFTAFKPGFGCLIPRHENFYSLGYIFSSSLFEGRVVDDDTISMTAIIRDGDPEKLTYGEIDKTDEQIVEQIQADLKKIFGLKSAPLEYKVWRWEKGIPLYDRQLFESCKKVDELLKTDFPHIRLFGNYTGNISIRGICTAAMNLANDVEH